MSALRATVAGLVCGLLFGVGLAVSQMTDPQKVLAFLDLLGDWDPSLMFTMGGAVIVTFIGYRWALGRTPRFSDAAVLPTSTNIDTRLVTGASLFGIGWGLAGYCPGPAVTGLAGGSTEPLWFLAAVFVGFVVAGARPAPAADATTSA